MAFERRDSAALLKAFALGVEVRLHGTVRTINGDQFLYEMTCPCNLDIQGDGLNDLRISAAGKCLSDAINAQTRKMAGAFLWVNVRCDVLPQYVREAIDDLKGFGTRMVVTVDQACSHAPGDRLDEAFCDAVVEANEGGMVWHPFAQETVLNR